MGFDKQLIENKLSKIMKMARKDRDILAVALFGSYVRNEDYRDIDICLFLKNKLDKKKIFNKLIKYNLDKNFDVKIFQNLPLYIRKKILEDGKIIFCRNKDKLYELSYDTIEEFESFKNIYESYIENALK